MRALPLLLLLLAMPARAGEWSVGPAPSDDPTMEAAVVLNDAGDALFLWSREGEQRTQVFAELHLGRGEKFAGEMPTYRIDGGAPVDTDQVRREGEILGALWGHVGESAAFWLAWTSIGRTILPSDSFAAWLRGREIAIDYKAADGAQHTARFPLAGIGEAVRKATGLEVP
jgi:hypothetical protein